MSVVLAGRPAAPGVATAAPWIYRPPSPRREGAAAGTLEDAARQAAAQLEALGARLHEAGHEEEAAILEAQALMATDEELLGAARSRMAAGDAPAAAVTAAAEAVASELAALDDEILAARAADVRDVAARIVRHLLGAAPPRLDRPSIVVAVDLAPSVAVELDPDLLAGIALEGGSRTSHAAILARALGIPAVVGVPDLMARAGTARTLAVDGADGVVVLDPDAAALGRLERAREAVAADLADDAEWAARPLATADGHRVLCFANVGTPDEARAALAAGAEGIGLFRTEFAFAGRQQMPSEEEQAEAYGRVLTVAGEAEVLFRLADIGGDKPVPFLPARHEDNPFLGVRAIRLAADHPELFPTQIRAILRASAAAGRPASIMAPMVADADDVALARSLVDDARAQVPDAPAPQLGIMVEIPSAVLLADELAAAVDFMSIGTNDLTQYLLAADRGNPALAPRQDAAHPAVLRAVSAVVEAAHRSPRACRVAVCGELAGDPVGACLLIGLGVDELSMAPAGFGAVKRAVAERSRADYAAAAREALSLSSAVAVRAMAGSA